MSASNQTINSALCGEEKDKEPVIFYRTFGILTYLIQKSLVDYRLYSSNLK